MDLYFKGEEQSLQDILNARDQRVLYQQFLFKKYKNTMVSFKLNIPGSVKYSPFIKNIFDEGMIVFKDKLKINKIELIYEWVMYKNSGPEYFAVFEESTHSIKNLATFIEDNHPLGRIFDFDVLDSDGKQISREDLGREPRKCLLCERNAFECGRSRVHDISDLISKIELMAFQYFS